MVTRVHYPKFSDAEYASRWKRIRDEMVKRKLDCLVVYGAYGSTFGNDAGQANLRWLTNFADQFHAYCVFPLKGDPTLVNSFFGHINSGKEVSIVQDMRFCGIRPTPKLLEVLREKGMEKAQIGIIGVDSNRGISVPYEHYMELTKGLPGANFVVATDMFERLRRTKSAEEIEFLRKGAAITDQAFAAAVKAAKPGARNIDLYNAIITETHRLGGTLTFSLLGSTPMANPSVCFPDPYISDRQIQKGDAVINETSSSYNGYSGQINRTIFIGAPDKHHQKLFDVGREVYYKVKDTIRPGTTTSDVLKAAEAIPNADLTVTAPLVHGWAYFIEPPVMGVRGSAHAIPEWTFEKNETIVIEPNPCSKDRKSGIFIGELCVVTDKGCESLHTFPLDEPTVVNGF